MFKPMKSVLELLDPALLKKKQKFKSEWTNKNYSISLPWPPRRKKKLGPPISPLQYFHEKKIEKVSSSAFETLQYLNIEEIEKIAKIHP
jgi:ribosomal protein L32E